MGRHYYQFGPYRLDPLARTLLRENEAVQLTPKAADTLRVLVQHPGAVVSKDTLLHEVWPGTFVEEGGLARNICNLRSVLTGFGPAGPIETIPRRGYRFTAAVSEHHENSKHARKVLAIAPIRLIDAFEDSSIGTRVFEAIANRLAMVPSFRIQTDPDGRAPSWTQVGPDYVLDSTIQKQNGSLRFSVCLRDTDRHDTVWAAKFDENLSDLFRLEDSLAEEIAGALGMLLSAEQPKMLSPRYTESLAAYQMYLRGRFHWNQRSEPEIRRAISCFRKALAEDPGYAPAFSALASSYVFMPMLSSLRSHTWMPRARAAAVSALQIDDTLAEARAALALMKWHYEWNWRDAEREYRRIIRVQPDHALAHQWYGLMLAELGRFNEARHHAALASELDASASIGANHATVLLLAGHYSEAIAVARDVLEFAPASLRARVALGIALQETGQMDEAIRQLEDAYCRSNDVPLICGELGHLYALSGRTTDAMKLLRRLENLPRTRSDRISQVLVHVALGNAPAAIELLNKACDEREFLLVLLGVDRRLDPLRSNPAFHEILVRIGLKSAAEAR